MDMVFLGIVIFLFLLAIFDLSVGVSNDAVNFLNSAIGAKAASFRTIITIAAIGVFMGAAMSNGMMDIARHGIFRPEYFHFYELICIFMAVMTTDIVLLDVFNSLGMPTSTTVSMVFELLGASFALAIWKVAADTTGLTFLDLLNTEKALSVILGIFLSVGIAFFFGSLVQYLTRLFFSFDYRRKLAWKIGIFGGVATTAIIYFLLIKGVKDLAFMTPDNKAWVNAHTPMIIMGCLVGFTLLMQLLHWCRVNVFKIVVLLGTFALAMAFAGNDLVNFIGVPLAGFSAYQDYAANGIGDPNNFLMGSLNEPARTPIVFLIAAGAIMVYSLATSKKAYNVVKTSVALARQDVGDEMFGSSRVARSLVRRFILVSNWVVTVTPAPVRAWVNSRFNTEESIMEQGAAFDLVRASVNLVLAGLLIVIGTTLKLPLSTTYVAFMVGMGSSLADRAWGRESAVYRITGVISVIGGWFITAGAAFLTCFLITNLMHFGGPIVMAACVVIILVILVKNNLKHKKADENSETDELFSQISESQSEEEVRTLLHRHIRLTHGSILEYTQNCFFQITDGLLNENIRELRKASNSINDEKSTWLKARQKEIVGMRKINIDEAVQKNTWLHLAANSLTQIFYCLKRISDPCLEHVDNYFNPLPDEYKKQYLPIRDEVVEMFAKAYEIVHEEEYNQIDALLTAGNSLKSRLSEMRSEEQNNFSREGTNIRLHFLYLNTLQETQELVSSLRHLLRATKRFYEG